MVRWDEYYHRFMGFWRQYRKSKMGIAGLAIIIFFLGMALLAPVVQPWPAPILVNQAPRLSAPTWLLPLDPFGFQAIYPINNTDFDTDTDGWIYDEEIRGEGYITVQNSRFDTDANGWTFTPFGPGQSIITNFTNLNVGSTTAVGSGPGCYEIQYNDSSTLSAYGITDTYLDYDFTFNASRYPIGFVTQYPSRISVSYSIEFIIDNTLTTLGDADAIFHIEISNSSGPAVEIYNRRYRSPGGLGWSSRTREMSQVNITRTFTATDTMTLSFHIEFRNPIALDTPQMVCRLDDLQCRIEALYNETIDNPLMSGSWDGSTGSNVSGPGSFLFSYADPDPLAYQFGSSASIRTDFTWDYFGRPKEAYIRYTYKIENTDPGGWGDAYVNIIQECYVENTDNLEQIFRGDNLIQDNTWTSSPEKVWDAFMITNTFEQRGKMWIIIRVEITDPTPEDTPDIRIHFDDCIFEILGGYYGELGAGQYGEDLWAQLLWGSRIALVVGLTAAFISTFVGLIVGLISGYFGGLVDEVLMRVTDFFLIIPGLPLMIVLAAILSPHWWNIVLVIALVGWTGTARLVRAQVLAERQRAYVEAARAIGASDLYIIFRHVLPNVTPLLFAQITLGVAGAILSEAGLSFLGLTHPHDVSWGRMLFQASGAGAYSEGAWWYVFFPGVCIVLLALSFTLVGYAVDEILNPRLRIRRE
jgi:peptide/nickel transport system permease protein